MEKIELVKDIENNCKFDGKKYSKMDDERYLLKVDDIDVVSYSVKYFRDCDESKYYSKAEIEYINLFKKDNNERYINKGYTKTGLEILTNKLLEEEIPEIYLNIEDNNETSKNVAISCGYMPYIDGCYYTFHDEAIRLYNKSVETKRNSNNSEIKNMYYDNFFKLCNKFSKWNEFIIEKKVNKIK